jgi:DNA-directed RNA polymerase specialized sigma24 family protein
MNSTSQIDLSSLILEARKYPVGSPKRQRLLTDVIRSIQRSGKVWRDYQIPVEQYQEALQQTLIYVCQHLETYDPIRANPLTWFNCILKFRIKDVRRKSFLETCYRQSSSFHSANFDQVIDMIDRIPAPAMDGAEDMLQELLVWLEQERSMLEQKSVRNHSAINVYSLIMRRLPTDRQMSWNQLSEEFGVSVPTLSSFYQRQCVPVLREFGQGQGWFE